SGPPGVVGDAALAAGAAAGSAEGTDAAPPFVTAAAVAASPTTITPDMPRWSAHAYGYTPAVSNVYVTLLPGAISASREPHDWFAPVMRWVKSEPLKNVTVAQSFALVTVGVNAQGSRFTRTSAAAVSSGIANPW